MTYPLQCWITRKKRTIGIRKPKSFFNRIPTDLQSKIFDKLRVKDQSSAMCVSKSWRELILYTTLPKEVPQQPLVSLLETPFQDRNLKQLFDWCSRVIHCSVGPNNLIDTCNGLLLFCCFSVNGHDLNSTHGIFHYVVINYFTKQCVAIIKPAAQTSCAYSYASLVYDPKESWFFKIMRFQGRRHVNVFSSEKGVWTTLTLCLPEYITASCWIAKFVYLNGSVYRLSRSGHLVRIRVDRQDNVSEQAETISLPPECLLDNCMWQLSVKDSKIFFAMSRDVYFVVCELVECVTKDVSSYSWRNICRIKDTKLLDFNVYGGFLSFHPHYEVVCFWWRKDLFYYFNYNGNNNNVIDLKPVPYSEILYKYLKHCRSSPLVECCIPFICCLNEKDSRVFERLPIPM